MLGLEHLFCGLSFTRYDSKAVKKVEKGNIRIAGASVGVPF